MSPGGLAGCTDPALAWFLIVVALAVGALVGYLGGSR